jgi:hypothetical protein
MSQNYYYLILFASTYKNDIRGNERKQVMRAAMVINTLKALATQSGLLADAIDNTSAVFRGAFNQLVAECYGQNSRQRTDDFHYGTFFKLLCNKRS